MRKISGLSGLSSAFKGIKRKSGLTGPALLLVLFILAALWFQSRFTLFGTSVRPYNHYGLEGFSSFEVKSEKDLPANTPCVSKSGKPQSIFFFMTGCPHCDKVKDDWAKYAGSATDVEPRQFEVSAAPNVCKHYGVTGFPTFIQTDAQGNVKSKERPF
jgi:thioredoxin-related protein